MLDRSIHWLTTHQKANILIAVIYFLLVVLPHDIVGATIHGLLFNGSIPEYNRSFLIVFGIAILFAVVPIGMRIGKHKNRAAVLLRLTVLVGLMLISYFTIMVLATEVVHFVQYAILAILIYPLTRQMDQALLWSILLGLFDEAYQYLVLDYASAGYYDFNDIILNTLGAGLGLLILRVYDFPPRFSGRDWVRTSAVKAVGLLAGVLVLGRLIGLWKVSPDSGDQSSVVYLLPEPPSEFWSTFNEISYHIIRPGEALVFLAGLVLVVLWVIGDHR